MVRVSLCTIAAADVVHASVAVLVSALPPSAYLCPDLRLSPGCNAPTANTVGTSGERSVQNSWILGDMHLNQVRQIAYQGAAVGVGGPPPPQQQASR